MREILGVLFAGKLFALRTLKICNFCKVSKKFTSSNNLKIVQVPKLDYLSKCQKKTYSGISRMFAKIQEFCKSQKNKLVKKLLSVRKVAKK